MAGNVPDGWAFSANTQDQARAAEIARKLRKDGHTVRVEKRHTSTLGGGRGGRGIPVTEYVVLRKKETG